MKIPLSSSAQGSRVKDELSDVPVSDMTPSENPTLRALINIDERKTANRLTGDGIVLPERCGVTRDGRHGPRSTKARGHWGEW